MIALGSQQKDFPQYCQGKHSGPVCKVAIVARDENGHGTVASLSEAADKSVELKIWDPARAR